MMHVQIPLTGKDVGVKLLSIAVTTIAGAAVRVHRGCAALTPTGAIMQCSSCRVPLAYP